MTRSELVTGVKRHVGNITATVGLTVDDAWYIERVAEGYRTVCAYHGPTLGPGARQPSMRRLRFRELEDKLSRTWSAGASTNFLANQSGVAWVFGLFDRTNDRELAFRPKRWFMRIDPEATGTPVCWTADAEGGVNGYRLWRVPDSTIQVYEYVYKTPTDLASDGAEPVIPEVWHPAIELAAAARAARLLHNIDKAMELDAALQQYIGLHWTESEISSVGGPRSFVVGRVR